SSAACQRGQQHGHDGQSHGSSPPTANRFSPHPNLPSRRGDDIRHCTCDWKRNEGEEINKSEGFVTIPYGVAAHSGGERANLKVAEIDFVSFGLQKNLAGSRLDVEAFVDDGAVDLDRNSRPGAETFDSGPFPERAGDVVFPARVDQLLEKRLVLRPPELLAGIDSFLASVEPAGAAILGKGGVAGDRRRERFAAGSLPGNDDEVAFTSLG